MLTMRFLWTWWNLLANLHPPRAAGSSIRGDRAAEAVLEEDAVARGQDARRLVGAPRRMSRLHARFAVMAVVEDGNREVRRALHADRRERAEPHQHLAVAGDDGDPAVGPGARQPPHA